VSFLRSRVLHPIKHSSECYKMHVIPHWKSKEMRLNKCRSLNTVGVSPFGLSRYVEWIEGNKRLVVKHAYALFQAWFGMMLDTHMYSLYHMAGTAKTILILHIQPRRNGCPLLILPILIPKTLRQILLLVHRFQTFGFKELEVVGRLSPLLSIVSYHILMK